MTAPPPDTLERWAWDYLVSTDLAHKQFVGATLVQIAAGRIFIAVLDCRTDVFDSETVSHECILVDLNLELLSPASHREYLSDARYRKQPLAHDPVRLRSQFDGIG